jgi:probable rRNA maturation factor
LPILYSYQKADFQLNNTDLINCWLTSLVLTEGKKVGKISFTFVDDNELVEINKKYLFHSYKTDIITFDYSFLDTVNGDIYISIDTVKRNWKEFHSLTYKMELYRIIVHGVLHLIGYNDKEYSEKLIMREKEDKYLDLFK